MSSFLNVFYSDAMLIDDQYSLYGMKRISRNPNQMYDPARYVNKISVFFSSNVKYLQEQQEQQKILLFTQKRVALHSPRQLQSLHCTCLHHMDYSYPLTRHKLMILYHFDYQMTETLHYAFVFVLIRQWDVYVGVVAPSLC